MWYNGFAKITYSCVTIRYLHPPVRSLRDLGGPTQQTKTGGCYFFRKVRQPMYACKLCFKFDSDINEHGVCDKCMKSYTSRVKLTLRYREGGELVPYAENGKVISKDRWLKIRREIDRLYNNISEEEIDKWNDSITPAVIKRKMPQRGHDEGFIYLIDTGTPYYKIGKSIDVDSRLMQHKASSPLMNMRLIHFIPVFNMSKCERFLIDYFSTRPIKGKEWIALTRDDVEWIKTLDTVTLEKLAKKS